MDDEGAHRPSILVIAPWHDGGNFRARITRTDPLKPTGKSSVVVNSKGATVRIVEDWLSRIEPEVESSS